MKVLAVTLVCLAQMVFAGTPLPKDPFITVWGAPSDKCRHKEQGRVDIELAKYTFVENPSRKFNGDYVTIFYVDSHRLGNWPHYRKVKGSDGVDKIKLPEIEKVWYGGLPQLGDLETHLAQVKKDINSMIPDINFEGLAVIDQEHFLVPWEFNFKYTGDRFREIFKIKSKELVMKEHQNLTSEEQVEAQAKHEFNKPAKRFMLETLRFAKKMRPKAHWGYYQYPQCHNHKANLTHCKDWDSVANDEIMWLYEASSSIHPSIYLGTKMNTDPSKNVPRNYVYGNLEESFRLAQQVKSHNAEVFPYTTYRYTDTTDKPKFYSKNDLIYTLKMAADFGSNGVVMYGFTDDYRANDKCVNNKKYVQQTLGPFVKRLTEYTRKCSKQECNNHGRCQLKDVAELLNTKEDKRFKAMLYRFYKKIRSWYVRTNNYNCLCYTGWKGDKCNTEA